MLRLDHIHAGYGRADCLFDISLEVREGEIVALLGANGAGKSTTLNIISGLLAARNGILSFQNKPLNCLAPHERVKQGLSHVPEGRRVLTRLTVLENLELGGYHQRDKAALSQDIERVFSLFPILADRKGQLAGTLSGGEQQMLAIGRGLMARPKLLLLDEPSLGLAPKLVVSMFEMIQRINKAGVSVLLVEQNAFQALQIANRAYVLEAGKIVLADSASNLAQNPSVKAAYLGG